MRSCRVGVFLTWEGRNPPPCEVVGQFKNVNTQRPQALTLERFLLSLYSGFQINIQVESICHLEKCIKRSIVIALLQSAYGKLLSADNHGNLFFG